VVFPVSDDFEPKDERRRPKISHFEGILKFGLDYAHKLCGAGCQEKIINIDYKEADFAAIAAENVEAGSDVPGWASSPEPAEPSPFKPKPGPTRMRA
jgi:hypothetical protein